MKNTHGIVLACALCAGSACSMAVAAEGPARMEVTQGTVKQVAHIYYNISSGERVVTLFGDQPNGQIVGADTGSSESLWAALVNNPCAAQGFTTSYFFGLDNNSGTSPLETGATLLDWGDIATDTVVDCVHINWVTDHDDIDADSDGTGDGVVGLSGQWTFWDAENGRDNRCTRLPIVSFIFADLPGDISGTTDPDDPANTLAGYTANIDLAATFTGTSLVFEIGDSDGDLQGALFGNNNLDIDSDGIGDGISIADSSTDGNGNPIVDFDFDGQADADLDGDNLFDWGWSVRFRQPGTADLDNDGVNEGDIADSMKDIGLSFGVPAGEAFDNGDGTWTWEIDTSVADAGTGSEDAFALFDSNLTFAGTFFFGGFSCDPDPMTGQYSPYTGFEFQLFGPGDQPTTCGLADLAEPFGVLNFFDVSAFLAAFNAGDPLADLVVPIGTFNFFDVSAFLAAFGDGCP